MSTKPGQLHSGKSVTNIEYLAARGKGIPVYAYVDREVLTLFEAWNKASPAARNALGSTVQDARLFEFIKQLRETDGVWTVGFNSASEIVDSLRIQLAYQTQTGLELQRSLKRNPERELLKTLTGPSFRLVVDRPQAWEYLLFAQVLADEVDRLVDLRREYDLALRIGAAESVTEEYFATWAGARLGEIQRLSEAANKLVNETLQAALGPYGVPGNPSDLVFVARQLARVYSECIQWALRVRRVHPPAEDFEEILEGLAEFSADVITKIGSWGREMIAAIERSLEEVRTTPTGGKKRTITFTLSFEAKGTERFLALLKEAYRKRGIP